MGSQMMSLRRQMNIKMHEVSTPMWVYAEEISVKAHVRLTHNGRFAIQRAMLGNVRNALLANMILMSFRIRSR